jgi:hypothetical protein
MSAVISKNEKFLAECAAELAEAAYPVVLEHGVKSPSVDVELDVWRAIRGALRKGAARDEVLAGVSDAAYRAALRHGLKGSFLDLELHLWNALGKVITGCAPAPA